MVRILLYAPSLAGHPQVYCRVIGRILLDAGARVVIAAGHDASTAFDDWHDLRPFSDEAHVVFVDTRTFSTSGADRLNAEELIELQRQTGADVTLFIEGDYFEAQFRRIADSDAPSLRGRNYAIFARTCEWYPGEDPYTGQREPLLGPTVRRTLGRLKRRVLKYPESQRYFFEEVLARKGVVDAIVTKDERVPERYGPPFHWMPEIYRVFDLTDTERRQADWGQFADPIRNYIETAGAENMLLYFGTGTWYKGYDHFLNLAANDPSAFALHAGAPDRQEAGKVYDFDVVSLRNQLLAEGRLFETRAYVESADLVDLLFRSVRCFVSTHRLTASSGTMLQALGCGTPVLMPDAGLVGWRTREFGVGTTYPYLDPEDLLGKWRMGRDLLKTTHEAEISSFMDRFSFEACRQFFVSLLLGGIGC